MEILHNFLTDDDPPVRFDQNPGEICPFLDYLFYIWHIFYFFIYFLYVWIFFWSESWTYLSNFLGIIVIFLDISFIFVDVYFDRCHFSVLWSTNPVYIGIYFSSISTYRIVKDDFNLTLSPTLTLLISPTSIYVHCPLCLCRSPTSFTEAGKGGKNLLKFPSPGAQMMKITFSWRNLKSPLFQNISFSFVWL